MNPKTFLLSLLIAALVVFGAVVALGRDSIEYPLFSGSNADTLETATRWIPIQGASRIYINTKSTGAATDTAFCDTIGTWYTVLSDTVQFIGRDSLGTLVTARSGMSSRFAFPVCFDTTMITGTQVDTTLGLGVMNAAVNRPLKGKGTWTMIYPTMHASGSVAYDQNGTINVKYLRIRFTPKQRLTTAGFSSTAGIRTRGIRPVRMKAIVVKD